MLKKIFDNWAGTRQAKELNKFLGFLRAGDGSEVGMVVACATGWRNRLRDRGGWDLLEPALCLAKNPMVTFHLSGTVKKLQRDGTPELACGLMVWVHTLRAMDRPELRAVGRSAIIHTPTGAEFTPVLGHADSVLIWTGEIGNGLSGGDILAGPDAHHESRSYSQPLWSLLFCLGSMGFFDMQLTPEESARSKYG
jgi:hypothetical protein